MHDYGALEMLLVQNRRVYFFPEYNFIKFLVWNTFRFIEELKRRYKKFLSNFHLAFTKVNYETLIKTKMLSSGKIVLTKLQSLLDFHHFFSINVPYLFQS